MKETMINKSDVEDDTTAAKDNALHLNQHSPKNLFAEKLLVPKIEPAMFVSPYWIIVIMITHLKVYNSTGELRFDLREGPSNTKNQCDCLSLSFFHSSYLVFIN